MPDYPTPSVRLRRVFVNTGSRDTEGRLVLADDQLVAVLVRLDGEEHDGIRGSWLLEAGFGPCSVMAQRPFTTLGRAKEWVTEQLHKG